MCVIKVSNISRTHDIPLRNKNVWIFDSVHGVSKHFTMSSSCLNMSRTFPIQPSPLHTYQGCPYTRGFASHIPPHLMQSHRKAVAGHKGELSCCSGSDGQPLLWLWEEVDCSCLPVIIRGGNDAFSGRQRNQQQADAIELGRKLHDKSNSLGLWGITTKLHMTGNVAQCHNQNVSSITACHNSSTFGNVDPTLHIPKSGIYTLVEQQDLRYKEVVAMELAQVSTSCQTQGIFLSCKADGICHMTCKNLNDLKLWLSKKCKLMMSNATDEL